MGKDSANLDFLRAYAVLSVYVSHLLQTFGLTDLGPLRTSDIGQTGVLIFFVHTSLVLMLSLERLQLRGRALFTSFYVRRAFRIYPLSIVVVSGTAILSIPSFPTQQFVWPGWFHFASNLALAQNLTDSPDVLAPLWSLPYEVQMYLLLPACYVLVNRFRSPWVPVGLWVAAVAFAPIQSRTIGRLSLMQYAPCFAGGILAFSLLRTRTRALAFWGWPAVITACFVVRHFGLQPGWIACLALGVAVPQFRQLRANWLRIASAMIARYSYGIYLTHVVVFWIAFVVLKAAPLWIRGGVCAGLSILLPAVMYHGLEKPMIGLGVRLAARFSTTRTAAVAIAR